jgi:hypothetical protein
MQTPAAVYRPSARNYPSWVPEPEYPESMLVRSVRPHGHFRWKQHDVFLSQVLWGENVGLWPEDDRWFTIYFAHLPLARFDSQRLRGTPLLNPGSNTAAGKGIPRPHYSDTPAHHSNVMSDTPCLGKSKLIATLPDSFQSQFGESNNCS